MLPVSVAKELGCLCSWKQYGMFFAPRQLREIQNRRRTGRTKCEGFLQRMRLEKALQPGRLQGRRTASEDEVENLRCRLLRDRPVQWSQSSNGQQLPVLGMRSSS